jgi:hypothetical protein
MRARAPQHTQLRSAAVGPARVSAPPYGQACALRMDASMSLASAHGSSARRPWPAHRRAPCPLVRLQQLGAGIVPNTERSLRAGADNGALVVRHRNACNCTAVRDPHIAAHTAVIPPKLDELVGSAADQGLAAGVHRECVHLAAGRPVDDAYGRAITGVPVCDLRADSAPCQGRRAQRAGVRPGPRLSPRADAAASAQAQPPERMQRPGRRVQLTAGAGAATS